MAWMDQDNTAESRALLAKFTGSGRFDVIANPDSDREAQQLLDADKVDSVVHVLPGLGRDVLRGRPTAVQVLVDGTNSNTASIVSSYAASIVGAYSSEVMNALNRDRLVGRTENGPVQPVVPRLTSRSRVWFNPDLRSRNYFIPGVVVNIIALVTLSLTAMAIVREKEIGTMEQLMRTPILPFELILGKTLPFAVFGLVDV